MPAQTITDKDSTTNLSRTVWSEKDVPDQTGRTFIITGATSGIGYETGVVLAERGANVILACRNVEKANEATKKIFALTQNKNVSVEKLDLSSLKSVRECAQIIQSKYNKIDVLINNAGVMVPPYQLTEDGFELQFGTNHLGHFLFTGLLLDKFLDNPESRIVTISSTAHMRGVINFDDLQSKREYKASIAYAQSKIANLLFTYELQRRFEKANAKTIAVAAHPGWSRTELAKHALTKSWVRVAFAILEPMLSQDQRAGAHPMLRAATQQGVHGGEYYGPSGFMGSKGDAIKVTSNARSHEEATQQRLWQVSEELTGFKYAI